MIDPSHIVPDSEAKFVYYGAKQDTFDHTLGWHTERLKAKRSIGITIKSPQVVKEALAEASTLGILLSDIGATEQEKDDSLRDLIAEAASGQSEPDFGNLTPIGRILKKRGAA